MSIRKKTLIIAATAIFSLVALLALAAVLNAFSGASPLVVGAALLGVAIVFVLVTMLLLQRMVLRPLAQLNADVRNIFRNRDLSRRLTVAGQDELGSLATEINGLLTSLQQSNRGFRELENEIEDRIQERTRQWTQVTDNLKEQITEEERAKIQFARLADEQERRVAMGTNEISKANAALTQEIIERKYAEEQLQRAHDELELRVHERTCELSQANEMLLKEVIERKQAEGERQKLVSLVENSTDFIALASLDNQIIYLNEAGRNLVGLDSAKAARANSLDSFFPAGASTSFKQNVLPALKATGNWEGESQLHHFRTGETITVHLSAFIVRHPENHQPLCVATVIRDITERKRHEEDLRQSEERFSKAFKATPIAIGITTLDEGRYVDANDTELQMLGYERPEMIGRSVQELGVWVDLETRAKIVAQLKAKRSVRGVEVRFRTKTGELRNALASAELIELDGAPCALFMTDDITERLSLEQQLRHSQKMEAVGQLAAGVAHDFNNIMTVVHGHTGMLLATPGLDRECAESLKQISIAADRAKNVTRQLLTFSRKQFIQRKDLDVNVIIHNLAKMLQRLLGEDIALQFSHSPLLPVVHGDTGMMEQIFMNLAVNSRDAMPKGGRLTITTSAVDIDDNYVRQRPEARTGHFACIAVSDTGRGMDAATMTRIFEPFFTTKEVGKGTGLGLATVYGIVKQHNGWIQCTSTPGEGTTFRVYLPGCGRALDADADNPSTAPARGGGEVILVVEDEPELRFMVEKILQNYGYRVLGAGNGIEAQKVWETHKDEIDLLLTDMVMPEGVTGRELAEKLVATKSRLKVIFTSGYSVDLMGKEVAGLCEGFNFLQKPYRPQHLAETVRNSLDGVEPKPERVLNEAML